MLTGMYDSGVRNRKADLVASSSRDGTLSQDASCDKESVLLFRQTCQAETVTVSVAGHRKVRDSFFTRRQ